MGGEKGGGEGGGAKNGEGSNPPPVYKKTRGYFLRQLQIEETKAESQQIVTQRNTHMLTIPRFIFKSSTKDLSPCIFELIIRRRPTSIL